MPNTAPPPGFPHSAAIWNSMSPQEQQLWIEGMGRTDAQRQAGADRFRQIPAVGTGVGSNPMTSQGGFTNNAGMGYRFDRTGGGMSGGGAGGSGGGGGGTGNWLKDNWLGLAGVGLGAWGAYSDYQNDRRSRGLEDRAIAFREQQYKDLEPLRVGAMTGLQNAARPDHSALTADPTNPYATNRIRRVGGGA